jgi:hypothetical protein
MKKILYIITTFMIISSCSTTRETKSSRIELREEKKIAEQAIVKEAVESKRFIIKLDRLYFSRGGIINLIPRANYIIIDGEKAIISAAYLGRQYDIRPIAGINLRGEAMNYELNKDLSRGMYEIKMKVTAPGNSFDVYLTIGKNGNCSALISNLRLDYTRYSGKVVPIREKINDQPAAGKMI